VGHESENRVETNRVGNDGGGFLYRNRPARRGDRASRTKYSTNNSIVDGFVDGETVRRMLGGHVLGRQCFGYLNCT